MRSYLTIQKMRYHTLHDEIDIDPQTEDCLLPKLVLQPLVENAIYHGIKVKQQGGTVRIESLLEEDRLLITVEDDGVGMTEEQARQLLSENKNEKTEFFREIGVSNVHKRLQYEFGEDYGLRVESRLSEFTTVSVLLPLAPQEDIG